MRKFTMLRKFAPLAAVVIVAPLLAACGESPESSESDVVIGYAGAIQSNPNNKAVEDAIRVKVEELGGRLVVTDAQFDASKQLTDVQSLINQRVDALVVWPVDPLGLQPALLTAQQAKIPVIVQHTTQGGPYTSNFQGDDEQAAVRAAQLIAEKVGHGAGVAQIEGVTAVGVLAARNNGFVAGTKSAGLDILAHQINQADSADGARPIVDAWKASLGSKIKAIFAYNDPSALGAASALDANFTPLIVGMNGSQEGVDAVKDGRLLATVDFHPVRQGFGLGWAAVQAAAGKPLPATVNVESTIITKDNAESWQPVAAQLKTAVDVSIVERDGQHFLTVTARP
ncbi:sugar ABC transporter substrate-binding protein [Micromonospora sp. CPCC 206060]|uniref:sugar ABC transporter substrate-binding protein n=1 Tax=Micromonospora sp. CPCC 206060 TaxID=3122406 RepID=UPI002FF13503